MVPADVGNQKRLIAHVYHWTPETINKLTIPGTLEFWYEAARGSVGGSY